MIVWEIWEYEKLCGNNSMLTIIHFYADASISTFLSPAALISISRRPMRMGKEHEPPDFTFFDEFCISLLHIFFAITYYVPPFRKLVNSLLSLPNVMKLLAWFALCRLLSNLVYSCHSRIIVNWVYYLILPLHYSRAHSKELSKLCPIVKLSYCQYRNNYKWFISCSVWFTHIVELE